LASALSTSMLHPLDTVKVRSLSRYINQKLFIYNICSSSL
jgi:hypothetical protein